MQNRLRKIIEEKGYAVGTIIRVTTPALLEALSYSGLDYVFIDAEHGTYDLETLGDLIRTAEYKGLCPIVRVSDATHREIQHAVDDGAEGIIIPCLRTVDDFKKVVDLGKFQPLGNRGYTKGRGSSFGNEDWSKGSITDFMENSNEKVLLLPQCETAESLEHIEEITAIEGLDGIVIGPCDLSISMGIPAQFATEQFQSALKRVLDACKANGKLCMIFTGSPAEACKYLDQGYDAVGVGSDTGIFTNAYKNLVSSIHKSE